jgi:cellobiose phosphorylase
MTRRFRGSTYRITVSTGAKGREITVDGKPQESNVVPAFEDGRTHAVHLRLPKATRRGARA